MAIGGGMDEEGLRIVVKELRELADDIEYYKLNRVLRVQIEYCRPSNEKEFCIRYFPRNGSDRTTT